MAPVPDDTDRELALRASRGDRDALAALYEQHKRRLLGFLQRMIGARGLAEDVFQDVWIKVMNTMHQYQPKRGPFRAWLYKVASNAALDRLRGEAVRSRWVDSDSTNTGESLLERTAAAGPDPEQSLATLETEQDLCRTLAVIETNQRTAILLRHQLGFTYIEIASILGVPEGTVKSLVHRGILEIRTRVRGKAQ